MSDLRAAIERMVDEWEQAILAARSAPVTVLGQVVEHPPCECPPCPGRGNDGHGMTHCAECCSGTGVEADIACPTHGDAATNPAPELASDPGAASEGTEAERITDSARERVKKAEARVVEIAGVAEERGYEIVALRERAEKAEAERDELAEVACRPLAADHPAIIDAEKRGHERGWDAAMSENASLREQIAAVEAERPAEVGAYGQAMREISLMRQRFAEESQEHARKARALWKAEAERDALREQIAAVEALADEWRYKVAAQDWDTESKTLRSVADYIRATLTDPGEALRADRERVWAAGRANGWEYGPEATNPNVENPYARREGE